MEQNRSNFKMLYILIRVMKNIYVLVSVLSILVSCTNVRQEGDTSKKLAFDKTKSMKIQMTSFLSPASTVHLDFSDSTIIDGNACLLCDDETYFVYSKGSAMPVMRFDKEGHFLNYISRLGNGPEEYNEIKDACLNKQKKVIEILSGDYIYVYDYAGNFVKRLNHHQPALSFAIDEKENYWFYLGNNAVADDAKMVKMDALCNNSQKLLHEKSSLLPMIETNFCKESAILTFKEILSHDIYRIADGKLEKSYSLDFPGYHLPNKLHETPPMEVVDLLSNSNYASVLYCCENEEYLLLQVLLNSIDRVNTEMYYWIYKKSSNKDAIICLDKTIPADSYIYYPQFLSENGKLYLMGFVLNEENDAVNTEENPAIVVVDVDIF